MALFSFSQSPFPLLPPYTRNSTNPRYPIQLPLMPVWGAPAIPSSVSWNPRLHIIRSLCSSGEGGSDFHPQAERPPSTTVFIRGLPCSTSEGLLKKTFSQFGSVSKVKICVDGISKESRGLAYVSFACEVDAKSSVKEMNGKFFEGRFIRVMLARPETPRKKATPYKF